MVVATIGSTGGLVSALTGGVARMQYRIPTGCKVDTPVTVSTVPIAGIISGADNVCTGQTILLTTTGTGGVWSTMGSGIITVAGGTVTGVAAGADTVVYTVTNMCGTANATKAITVNATPSAGVISGADSICIGTTIMLTETVSGGVWSTITGNASVSASGMVNGVSAGADTIVYTVADAGCSARTEHMMTVIPLVDCPSLGVVQHSTKDELRVWPNPNEGVFSVELKSGMDEAVRIVITNVVGQRVMEVNGNTNRAQAIKLPAAANSYFVTVITKTGRYTAKVVAQ
jgi:hypothetical protein